MNLENTQLNQLDKGKKYYYLKLGLEQTVRDFSYSGYDMYFPEFQIIEKYDYFDNKKFQK